MGLSALLLQTFRSGKHRFLKTVFSSVSFFYKILDVIASQFFFIVTLNNSVLLQRISRLSRRSLYIVRYNFMTNRSQSFVFLK